MFVCLKGLPILKNASHKEKNVAKTQKAPHKENVAKKISA